MNIISELKKVKRDFLQKSRFKKLANKVGVDIIQSTNFKNVDIKECFKDRIISTREEIIIERIIKAYRKAKQDQKGFAAPYQVGNEWLPIYERYMNSIIKALTAGDKQAVNSIYENFMREDCSVGLHGMPTNMANTYFGDKITKIAAQEYLYDALYRYKHWKEITANQYGLSDLKMPDYGNSYGYYVDNEYVRTGAEYLHYYATRIAELTSKEQGKKIVVELGGGYGGLGYFINKLIPEVTYVDFDLPENMALTSYFLMNSFPDKKILLYGEGECNEENLQKYDIIIMPNFEISKLPTAKANLVFNSYSLAEMSTETINTYIPELKRASKAYFFHVNHSQLSHSLKADEFGIDDENFKLISKQPALWNMGRDANMDEFEYLYDKSASGELKKANNK